MKIKIILFILFINLSCLNKRTGDNFDYWKNENINYLESCCNNNLKGSFRSYLNSDFLEDSRKKIINKIKKVLDVSNNLNYLETYNREHDYIRIVAWNDDIKFSYFYNINSKEIDQSGDIGFVKTVLRRDWYEELKNTKFCCNSYLNEKSFFIFSMIEIGENDFRLINSFVGSD